jgi:hypothetical protein
MLAHSHHVAERPDCLPLAPSRRITHTLETQHPVANDPVVSGHSRLTPTGAPFLMGEGTPEGQDEKRNFRTR